MVATSVSTPSRQQTALALKKIIESSFTSGIDAVLSFALDEDNTITGKFLENRQVYTFEISPKNRIRYVEAQAKSDAYLAGFVEVMPIRLDKMNGGKKKRCIVGKACGGTCIAKGKVCDRELSPKAAQLSNAVRKVLGGSTTKPPEQKFPKINPGLVGAAVFAAGVLGVPVAGYLATRATYRAGFSESAEIAKKEAEKLATQNYKWTKRDKKLIAASKFKGEGVPEPKSEGEPAIPDVLYGGTPNERYFLGEVGKRYGKEPSEMYKKAKQITLVANGFAGEDNTDSGVSVSGDLMGNDGLFDDHHVVPIDASGFSPNFMKGEEIAKNVLEKVFKEGRNPVAVRMASHAYAFSKKHPDVPINLIGYSGAGMATHEAQEILKQMGVKVRVANFGSPYGGLTEKVGDSVTFNSPSDFVTRHTPVRDEINVPHVDGHFKYLLDSKVRGKLRDYFDGKKIKGEPTSLEQERHAQNVLKKERSAFAEKQARLREIDRKRKERGAKRSKKKLDSIKPNCSPKSKLCGTRCVPKEYNCKQTKQKPFNATNAVSIGVGIAATVGLGAAIAIPASMALHTEIAKNRAETVKRNVEKEEDAIKDSPVEHFVIINPKTGKTIAKGSSNEATRVDIPTEAMGKMKGAIFTHNHPKALNFPESHPQGKGTSFSEADIRISCQMNVKEMRAVSRKYRHSLSVGAKGWGDWDNQVKPIYDKHDEQLLKECQDHILSRKYKAAELNAIYHHELNKRVAKDMGWTYIRTPI